MSVLGYFSSLYIGLFPGPSRRAYERAAASVAGDRQREALVDHGSHGEWKTLASFLWAIDQLATGEMQGGRTRVLYVSLLKALNNDIQRNLLTLIEGLEQQFAADCRAFPETAARKPSRV